MTERKYFVLEVCLENAAFESPQELERILTSAASHAGAGNLERSLRDLNGNVVGRSYVSLYPPISPSLKQMAVLREAREFIDRHSEEWYISGQKLLKEMDEVLRELGVGNSESPSKDVFVTLHQHKYGTTVNVYFTREGAEAARALIARRDWTDFSTEPPPEDPNELTERYWDNANFWGDEFFEIYPARVED